MIFSIFKKKKDFVAKILPGEQLIKINKGETLLSGALRSGLAWPHKCQVGSCGTCRCKIINGSIRPEIDFNYVLDPADVASGFILACQSTLKTDIKVLVNLNKQGSTI